jgi:hypothetical protein
LTLLRAGRRAKALPSVRRAGPATGPRARPSRTSSSERADSVNMTAAGCVSVSVTIGDGSEACTTLPESIRRTPVRPSLGATMEV